jgi:hypothetical protein
MIPGELPPNNSKPVKIKIEFNDDTGTKYTFNIEGSSKDNINKLIDFAQTISTKRTRPKEQEPIDTNFAKLYGLLQTRFQFSTFTSNDVLHAYQQDLQIPTSLSVISTYLSRLASRGLLTRNHHGSGWVYKLMRTQHHEDTIPEEDQPTMLFRNGDIPR